jgi:O-antigen/teichoic acid export membrane protein
LRLRNIRSLLVDAAATDLARNAFALWGGQLANFCVGFFSLMLYGVLFSRPQIAVINLFEMVAALLLSLGFTWSAIALVRFGEDEYASTASLSYTSSLRLSLVLPILVFAGGAVLFFREQLLAYIGTADSSIVTFLLIDLFLIVAREHFVHLLNTTERHRVNAAIYFGMSLGKLAVLLI